MADAHDVLAEDRRGPDVVGVRVRVDQVRDLRRTAVGPRHLGDRPQKVVPDRRRRVDQGDAVPGAEEHRLVEAVGDPVEVSADPADEVPRIVEVRPGRGGGDRCEVGKAWSVGRVGGALQGTADHGCEGQRGRRTQQGPAVRRGVPGHRVHGHAFPDRRCGAEGFSRSQRTARRAEHDRGHRGPGRCEAHHGHRCQRSSTRLPTAQQQARSVRTGVRPLSWHAAAAWQDRGSAPVRSKGEPW